MTAAPVTIRLHFDTSRGAAGIEALRLDLLRQLAGFDLTDRCVYALELVLEEWLINVMRHGAPAGESGEVEIQVRVLPQVVELRFEDRQLPFDPLQHASARRPASIDDASPGGLGLDMIRLQTCSLHYQRVGERNVLLACVPRHADTVDA